MCHRHAIFSSFFEGCRSRPWIPEESLLAWAGLGRWQEGQAEFRSCQTGGGGDGPGTLSAPLSLIAASNCHPVGPTGTALHPQMLHLDAQGTHGCHRKAMLLSSEHYRGPLGHHPINHSSTWPPSSCRY